MRQYHLYTRRAFRIFSDLLQSLYPVSSLSRQSLASADQRWLDHDNDDLSNIISFLHAQVLIFVCSLWSKFGGIRRSTISTDRIGFPPKLSDRRSENLLWERIPWRDSFRSLLTSPHKSLQKSLQKSLHKSLQKLHESLLKRISRSTPTYHRPDTVPNRNWKLCRFHESPKYHINAQSQIDLGMPRFRRSKVCSECLKEHTVCWLCSSANGELCTESVQTRYYRLGKKVLRRSYSNTDSALRNLFFEHTELLH